MNDLIKEMKEYYCRRAPEYDDWLLRRNAYDKGPTLNSLWSDDLALLWRCARSIRGHSILELSCGTGMWTQHLANHNSIFPTDSSSEMLDITEQRTGLRGIVVDNFDLQIENNREYDMCFFAFWLSHVPEDRVASFFTSVRRSVNPGSRLLIFDSYLNKSELNCLEHKKNVQIRALRNGEVFRVYKRYLTRPELENLGSRYCSSYRIDYTPNYFYMFDGNLKTDDPDTQFESGQPAGQ